MLHFPLPPFGMKSLAFRDEVRYTSRMTHRSRNDEIEDFKSKIDLCGFVGSWAGFILDVKKSGKTSAVLGHTNGDKLIIARKSNGHYIYFNVRDARDRGTIIDFVQQRERLTLGAVRKLLRPYVGRTLQMPSAQTQSGTTLQPSQFDVASVHARWLAASPLPPINKYLEQDRQLLRSVLDHPKFADRIRTDVRCNALFPHFNNDGLCGFESKNRGWTSFSPGGVKGLWSSIAAPDDLEILIFETAIDALSLASIEGTNGMRFVSTAGHPSPMQNELLLDVAQTLGSGGKIVIAVDNDEGGDRMLQNLRHLLAQLPIAIEERRPPARGKDWNDVLRDANRGAELSLPWPA